MKRILMLVLSGALALMLGACGDNAEKKADAGADAATAQSTDAAAATDAAPAADADAAKEGMDTGAAAEAPKEDAAQ